MSATEEKRLESAPDHGTDPSDDRRPVPALTIPYLYRLSGAGKIYHYSDTIYISPYSKYRIEAFRQRGEDR